METTEQKMIIATVIAILTKRVNGPEELMYILKKVLPKDVTESANFTKRFNEVVLSETDFFEPVEGNSRNVFLREGNISQVAEIVEQYHNFYASIMDHTTKSFEFLDVIKQAVYQAKYIRDQGEATKEFCNKNNITLPEFDKMISESEEPYSVMFPAKPATEEDKMSLLEAGLLPRKCWDPKNRIPVRKLPLSALLAPLHTKDEKYNGHVNVGFFE